MKNKVGFVAIGQAGGNIGVKFEKLGYSVLYLNTSSEDLETLSVKHKYHIKGGEGCNKDRNKAKDLVIEDFENIANEIQAKVNKEIIGVIFSAGGGSGSGASPMAIDLMIQNMNKKVFAATIFPSDNESLKTHINAYECFRELEEIEGLGATLILDNNACENKLSINKDFVESFDKFLQMSTHKNVRGNVDNAEVVEMLTTKGMMVISNQTKSGIGETVESIKGGIFAPIEADKVIKYIGCIADATIQLDDYKKEYGNCIDCFQGYSKENLIVLSGLTYPYERIEKIKNVVINNQDSIIKNMKVETKKLEGISFLDDIKTSSVKKDTTTTNDIFAKYRKK